MVKDRKGQQSTTVIRRRSPEYIKEKMIEDVLEHFDFDKCQYVMKQLNWQWFGRGIPTIDELKYSARQRLESAIAGALDRKDTLPLNSYYFSSSGGLKATAWRNRYWHLEAINLEFVLTEWDSDGDYVTDKKNENKTTERNNL
jgi:hypothetical protein